MGRIKDQPLTREGEPSQKTAKGLEIPIPSREEFFEGLKRAARKGKDSPAKPSQSDPAMR
jgi:hypothetical protein